MRRSTRAEPGRRTIRVLIPLLLLFLIAVGVMIWLAFFTSVCGIDRVLVEGNGYLSDEYVRGKSGVESYRNLVTLPVGKIDENLESDPWIESAFVTRSLLHTVRLEIVERVPIAVVDFNGAAFLLDAEGYCIEKTSLDLYGELPRVHGGDASLPRVDSTVRDKRIRECISLLASMPAGVRAELALVNPFDGRGYVFISRIGYHIIYGPAEECDEKEEILEAIMVDIKNNNREVAYVDVSVPEAPVIKY